MKTEKIPIYREQNKETGEWENVYKVWYPKFLIELEKLNKLHKEMLASGEIKEDKIKENS